MSQIRRCRTGLLCLLLVCSSSSTLRADQPSRADQELVQKVWKRIVAVTDPVPRLEWPPECTLEDIEQINAFATVDVKILPKAETGDGKEKQQKYDVKVTPKVVVFRGMMEKVIHTASDKDMDAAADRLAYILGHEMSHILLGHCLRPSREQTPLVRRIFDREQEVAADVKGAELALKAGFSLRRGLESIRRMQKMGLEYSSFEGLSVNHPSWNDRLVHLDKDQAGLWKAMSAFENGTFFLLTEQFVSAEICFRQVTREFPKCYEAWTNLGYALLMQYCDGLETEDLRRFQIGHLLIGGFYRRPRSLESETRGIQNKIWDEAVACLQKSLQLKHDQAIAKADLGIAYLVHPDGTPDIAKATKYLHEAAEMAQSDNNLDSLSRAAILINAGVADLAGRRVKEGVQKLDHGEKLGMRDFGTVGRLPISDGLTSALLYNRALLLAAAPEKDKQEKAAQQLEQYLDVSHSAGAWWPLAYERYAELCKKLGKDAKKKEDLADPPEMRRRLVTSVKLSSGITLALSEPLTDAAQRLGEKVPVVSRTKLTRLRYPQHGIEVLATDRILAIHLIGDKAPPLPLRDVGLGSKTEELRLDMPEQALTQILKAEGFDDRPLDDPKVVYRFYPRLGLAVRIKDKKVADLAIAQIPRKRLGE